MRDDETTPTSWQDYVTERAASRAQMQKRLCGSVPVFIEEAEFLEVQKDLGLYRDLTYAEHLDASAEEFREQSDLLGACDYVRITPAELSEFLSSTFDEDEEIREEHVDLFADIVAAVDESSGTGLTFLEWLRYERLVAGITGKTIDDKVFSEVDELLAGLLSPAALGEGFRSVVLVHDEGEVDVATIMVESHQVAFGRGSLPPLKAALTAALLNGGRLYVVARSIDTPEAEQVKIATFRCADGRWTSLGGDMLKLLTQTPRARDLATGADPGEHLVTVLSDDLTAGHINWGFSRRDDGGVDGLDPGDLGLTDLLISTGLEMTLRLRSLHGAQEKQTAWKVNLLEATPLTAGEAFQELAVTEDGNLKEIDSDVSYGDAWQLSSVTGPDN